jgi:dolichol-phosphate mannosyltransferase
MNSTSSPGPAPADNNFAVVVPMANEEAEFTAFTAALQQALDDLGSGTVYFVVDNVSKDNTLALCRDLARSDPRFVTVWAPENRNVVDAYIRGFREACEKGHACVVEMDAGLSHNPAQLPRFLDGLQAGYECVFGSRNMPGGSNADSPPLRRLLSATGTLLANLLLGSRLQDMTSGYEAFHRDVVKDILDRPLRSQAHFYQTELRYLLRRRNWLEVPITYRAPSPSISRKAVVNSLKCLLYYFRRRLSGKAGQDVI